MRPLILVLGIATILALGIFYSGNLSTHKTSCEDGIISPVQCTLQTGTAELILNRSIIEGKSFDGFRLKFSNSTGDLYKDVMFPINSTGTFVHTLTNISQYNKNITIALVKGKEICSYSIISVPCVKKEPSISILSFNRSLTSNSSSNFTKTHNTGGGGGGGSPPSPENSAPSAEFTFTPGIGDAPLRVTFDASSSSDSDGTISLYQWDFGDNSPIISDPLARTTSHTFNQGTFTVKLIVKDNSGAEGTKTHEISVLISKPTECSDNIDNDNDGAIDSLDLACQGGGPNENSYLSQCQDGIDNDGNGLKDYPADPGCSDNQDDSEYTRPSYNWGLLNQGKALSTPFFSQATLTHDSVGNLLYFFREGLHSSTHLGRFNIATKAWEAFGKSGWSSNPQEPFVHLGSLARTDIPTKIISNQNSVLTGLTTSFVRHGPIVQDNHNNEFMFNFDETSLTPSFYNGQGQFDRFSSSSLIHNYEGSLGGVDSQNGKTLFVKGGSFASGAWATDYRATLYDSNSQEWKALGPSGWHSYRGGTDYNTFTPLPFSPTGSNKIGKFYDGSHTIIASIPQTNSFIIFYTITDSVNVYHLRAAKYEMTTDQWTSWNSQGWSSDFSNPLDLASSVNIFQLPTNGKTFTSGTNIFLLYALSSQIYGLEYDSASQQFNSLGSIGNADTFAARVSPSGTLSVVLYTPQAQISFKETKFVSNQWTSPKEIQIPELDKKEIYLVDYDFLPGDIPVLFFQRPSSLGGYELVVVSDLSLPFWANQIPLSTFNSIPTSSLDSAHGHEEAQWISQAQIDFHSPQDELTHQFTSSYGPTSCGHMALDSEGYLFCPKAGFGSTLIFPPNYVQATGYSDETARQWGNFWDYFWFPSSVVVDSTRGKVYIGESDSSHLAGGSEFMQPGGVQIWDLNKKRDFVIFHWLDNLGYHDLPTQFRYSHPEIKLVGTTPLRYPGGLALDETRGILYVVERSTNKIHRFDVTQTDASGIPRYIDSFGSFGYSEGQFSTPEGIDVDSSGFVYVVDSDNSRIEVFNPQGQFVRSFGSYGTQPGLFNQPYAIAIDKVKNYIYVSDVGNNRIQIFDLQGNFVYSFTSWTPASPVQTWTRSSFTRISGLAVHDNLLFVSQMSAGYNLGTISRFQMNLP